MVNKDDYILKDRPQTVSSYV